MIPIIGDRELEKITLEHLLKIKRVEDEACHMLKERIENLVSRVLLRINERLKSADLGKAYDRYYYVYLDLLKSYEGLLESLNNSLITMPEGKEQAGCQKLITFVENAMSDVPTHSDNPVVYERMVLLNSGILRIKQHIENLIDTEHFRCELGNIVHRDKLLSFMQTYVMALFQGAIPDVQSITDDIIHMMAGLEEGKKYEQLCYGQQIEFESMASEWIELVEAALIKADGNENIVIAKGLEKIFNIFEDLKIDLDTEVALPKAETVIDIAAIEALIEAHIFGNQSVLEPIFKKVDQVNEESCSQVRSILEDSLSCIYLDLYQQLKNEGSGYQKLSREIVALFKQVLTNLSAHTIVFRTEQGQAIAKGIEETVALKVDNLIEKDQAYQRQKEEVILEIEKGFGFLIKGCLDEAENILEGKLLGTDQPLLKAQLRFSNGLDKLKIRDFDIDKNYLANELLLELRTFDELVNQSMKKLIELESDLAEPVMTILIDGMNQSRNLLMAHHIHLIIPVPHESFDGKIHEVLMAEVTDGFAKGEIIDKANVGYRLKDQVILRASVIAAR